MCFQAISRHTRDRLNAANSELLLANLPASYRAREDTRECNDNRNAVGHLSDDRFHFDRHHKTKSRDDTGDRRGVYWIHY